MNVGDVTVVIHKADDLVSTRKSQNHTYSVIMKMEKQKFKTKQIKFTDSPIWQDVAIFKSSKIKPTSVLKLVVVDKEEVIGQVCIPYSQLNVKPSEPTILEAPLMPHKKCPKPLGGTLYYEAWKSLGSTPEVPRQRVITGEDYFAANERGMTLPSRQNSSKEKSSTLRSLFGSSTNLAHAMSPSISNLAGHSKKAEKWNMFTSYNDLSEAGRRGNLFARAATSTSSADPGRLGVHRLSPAVSGESSVASSTADVASPSTASSVSAISLKRGDSRTSPSSRPTSRPSFADSAFDETDTRGDGGRDSFSGGDGLGLKLDKSPTDQERLTPDGSRHPEPAVSPIRRSPEAKLVGFPPTAPRRIRGPATQSPPAMTTTAHHRLERIIQGSEDDSGGFRESGLTGVCATCGRGAKDEVARDPATVQKENRSTSPPSSSLADELTDLRVKIHDLEEANAAMRTYLETIVTDVMEECPWILEKSGDAKRKRDKNKFATVGHGRLGRDTGGFDLAKKMMRGNRFGKPIWRGASLSRLFGGSKSDVRN